MLKLLIVTGVIYAIWIICLMMHEAVFGQTPVSTLGFNRDDDGDYHRPSGPNPRPTPRHEPEVEQANARARATSYSHL